MRYSTRVNLPENRIHMVVEIEENGASTSGFESEEFIVPEFGQVNLSWFDFSCKYRGAIYRLGQDASKQIAEIVGFSANFEQPGIHNACLDLFRTEGYCLFEIERNTKPTDLAVHYSRERWNLLESTGKAADVLRPWIKTEYRAKYIPEKVFNLVGEQLKMQPELAANAVIRINFKDRTFALICPERYEEQMPTGSFSRFSLPSEAMLALGAKYGKLDEPHTESIAPLEQAATASAEADSKEIETEIRTFEEKSITVDEKAEQSSVETAAGQEESVTEPKTAQQETEPVAVTTPPAEPASTQTPVGESTPAPAPAPAVTETASQSSGTKITPEKEVAPLPEPHKSLEQFIQRRADRPPVERRPVERPVQHREPSSESFSPKYATYSRSEVDQMFKQQSETIITALGSKISSQQRVFQEAVERQEKSFAKLSDSFVVQFDQTRIRLENSSKESTETIGNELGIFKKDLSKELEQYRAQINKAVVPVAKFIEDKNAKPIDKAQKEVSQAKGQQGQKSADNFLIRTLLFANIALVIIIPLALWLAIIAPALEKMQSGLDQVQSKITAPPARPASKPENNAGNLNGTNDRSHPVTPSGSSGPN